MQNEKKVRPLKVIPDNLNPHDRMDRLGNFDYSNGFQAQLFTRTPNATIYYSLTKEGDAPSGFVKYDPHIGASIPRMPLSTAEPLTITYQLKAYAVCPGMKNSDILERTYTLTRKPCCESQVLPLKNSMGLIVPDAWLIHDYDNDTMILINGSEAALLFDTGFYAEGGDLYGTVRHLIGENKKLYVVHSHNGPDHIQMTWQFIDKHNTEIYINDRDRYVLEEHIRSMLKLPDNDETSHYLDCFIHNAKDGNHICLGSRTFRIIEMPGHTFGHICLLDEKHGDFLVGDCIGSNSILAPGSLWMWNIVPRVPLNDFLSILHIFKNRIRRLNICHVYTGHYNRPFDGKHLFTYLDNLTLCVEKLIDFGLPQTEIGSSFPPHAYVPRAYEGEALTNPWYAGIVTSPEIMYEPEYLDGKEEKNDEMCYLEVRTKPDGDNLLLTQEGSGLGISMNFIYHDIITTPDTLLEKSRTRIEHPVFHVKLPSDQRTVFILPITGSHFSRVYINGKQGDSTYLHEIRLDECIDNAIELKVISEDGSCERHYTVNFSIQ